MIEALTVGGLVVIGLALLIAGAFLLIVYKVMRMLGSDGWDDSNVLNAFRLEAHAAFHPEDFGKMYYLTDEELALLKENGFDPKSPFWYIGDDEFESVVDTRPEKK